MTIEIEPGKGMELKSHMTTGAGMLFRWTSSAPVAVDMHGERPDVKGALDQLRREGAQSKAEGTFIAPFDGTHGWWLAEPRYLAGDHHNELNGYQADLYQP
jgi:hypothetical protein